jgi:hypothetical protein
MPYLVLTRGTAQNATCPSVREPPDCGAARGRSPVVTFVSLAGPRRTWGVRDVPPETPDARCGSSALVPQIAVAQDAVPPLERLVKSYRDAVDSGNADVPKVLS